jgi:pimeloyl-ACP methyl ester carboxylesterase
LSGTAPLPLVLVPGACLGGWCWREVADHLRAAGHVVYPVTLTGLGERVHLANRDVDLDTHIEDVVNVLDYEDLHDVALVGHSYAGPVITGVADRRPERLAALVYLDTAPLPDGMAIADVQSDEQRREQLRGVSRDGDGWRWPVPDRETLESGLFGSTSGLRDSDFHLIERLATSQPYATFTSALRLAGNSAHELRRVAIFCSAGGMSVATLRALIADGDPRAASFASPAWELAELDTGHWAMLSAPAPLSELLHQMTTPAGHDGPSH